MAQFLEPWHDSFFNGCCSNTRSNLYATCLVSCGPWTEEGTPGLLATMFMSQYSRTFADPWVSNTAAPKVINFLTAVENQLNEQRGTLMFLKFRACVRQSALDAFYLSIDFVSPFPGRTPAIND
jgi:hypothetical protein